MKIYRIDYVSEEQMECKEIPNFAMIATIFSFNNNLLLFYVRKFIWFGMKYTIFSLAASVL